MVGSQSPGTWLGIGEGQVGAEDTLELASASRPWASCLISSARQPGLVGWWSQRVEGLPKARSQAGRSPVGGERSEAALFPGRWVSRVSPGLNSVFLPLRPLTSVPQSSC